MRTRTSFPSAYTSSGRSQAGLGSAILPPPRAGNLYDHLGVARACSATEPLPSLPTPLMQTRSNLICLSKRGPPRTIFGSITHDPPRAMRAVMGHAGIVFDPDGTTVGVLYTTVRTF